jgi:two-component system, NtrC family, sensor kinase
VRVAWKLIATITVSTAFVLAIHGYLSIRRETLLIEANTRDDLSAMGRALRPAMVKVWTTEGQARALEVVQFADERLRRVRVHWVQLDAPAGSPHAPKAPPSRLQPLASNEEVALVAPGHDDRFLVYVPVRAAGVPASALELEQSLERERQFVRATFWSVALTTAAVTAGSALLVLLLGTWLIGRPLGRLVLQARRIGAGDFSARVRPRAHDEIGEVGREMDYMCDRLAAAKEALVAETAARLEAVEQVRHAERLATLGKLASGVAHEINTPLTVIIGRANLIADGGTPAAQLSESARTISAQAKRIATIVRQMLDFARVRGSSKDVVDPAATVREVLRLVAAEAQKADVTMVVQDDSEHARVWADAGQLHQVVTNIVINGIQSMPGGGLLSVALTRARRSSPGADHAAASEHLGIAVADSGVGIPPEHLEHIFEPFYTTKGVGQGTGLGLSVAHGIVQEHGGWIEVESVMVKGSRFTVWLPVHHGATPVESESGAEARTGGTDDVSRGGS